MKLVAAALEAHFSLSCATVTPEQTLVNPRRRSNGRRRAHRGDRTTASRRTSKYWEPEQSDVPGGEPRFAAESTLEVESSTGLAFRSDWVKNFAYPAPRVHLQRDRHAGGRASCSAWTRNGATRRT